MSLQNVSQHFQYHRHLLLQVDVLLQKSLQMIQQTVFSYITQTEPLLVDQHSQTVNELKTILVVL
jgi:hypothetical protein